VKIITDIWGGNRHQDHLARFVVPLYEAMQIAREELDRGFLVNLRAEANWHTFTEFDKRRDNIVPLSNRRNL